MGVMDLKRGSVPKFAAGEVKEDRFEGRALNFEQAGAETEFFRIGEKRRKRITGLGSEAVFFLGCFKPAMGGKPSDERSGGG